MDKQQQCRKRTAAEVVDDTNKMGYYGTSAVSWCFPFRVDGSSPPHNNNNRNGNFKASSSSKKFHGSDNADALLAKEMNSLSLDERERVFEDIHAVPRKFEETPKTVQESLMKMTEHIEKIKKKSAYDKAMFMCPSYVENDQFKLMFLRCENFDPKKSAIRYVTHFENKLTLFGSSNLVRSIKFDDLSPDDQAAVMTGSTQFLPTKDRVGRTVACDAQKFHNYKHWKNHIKAYWYLAMSHLEENEDTQRLGLVSVIYCIGKFHMSQLDKDMMTNGMELTRGLPIRFSALHYCFDDPRLRPVISFAKLLVDTSTRLRFRAHFGSNLECQYELMSYGISRKTVPIDAEGNLIVDEFLARLSLKRQEEAIISTPAAGSIDDPSLLIRPGRYDVLLGRGRPYQEYEGNLYLAEMIDVNRNRYQNGGRGQKCVIAEEIVHAIQNLGGRFLKKTDDGRSWLEVSDEVARDKVGHGFRTKTRRNSTRNDKN